jgi:hypothetical protein
MLKKVTAQILLSAVNLKIPLTNAFPCLQPTYTFTKSTSGQFLEYLEQISFCSLSFL